MTPRRTDLAVQRVGGVQDAPQSLRIEPGIERASIRLGREWRDYDLIR
jgi:hypothetical protein